jgi:hypothetical protein
MGRTLALAGFGGCRVECLDITVAPKREIQIGTTFKLNHDHDPRSHENGRRKEKEPVYVGSPWLFRARVRQRTGKNLIR